MENEKSPPGKKSNQHIFSTLKKQMIYTDITNRSIEMKYLFNRSTNLDVILLFHYLLPTSV